MRDENIIEVRHLQNNLGGQWVHRDVNLTIKRGEIIAIIGGSGCGKTTLLRSILRLMTPTGGDISVFGVDVLKASPKTLLSVQKRWGVMFQSGALFSSLTVMENVLYVLNEYASVSYESQNELAKLKIAMIHAAIGKMNLARTEFTQISKTYPGTTAAQLANIRLQQLANATSVDQ